VPLKQIKYGGIIMSYCFGCGENIGDNDVCPGTGKIGYRCFECGARGHLDKNDPHVYEARYKYVGRCPHCGTTQTYDGSMLPGEQRGIASGSSFGWR
jgi:DNA-directed RNA polymerase subunit RPC12/RpoP